MPSRIAATALAGLALAAAAGPGDTRMSPPERRSTNLPRPRDPDIAVQEELDAARKAGTIAAYDLFLARNGSHALGAAARRERERLKAERPGG
jgi:hypothetical protein